MCPAGTSRAPPWIRIAGVAASSAVRRAVALAAAPAIR
jgi:hypothetical protein